jgi:hypothetical protein
MVQRGSKICQPPLICGFFFPPSYRLLQTSLPPPPDEGADLANKNADDVETSVVFFASALDVAHVGWMITTTVTEDSSSMTRICKATQTQGIHFTNKLSSSNNSNNSNNNSTSSSTDRLL